MVLVFGYLIHTDLLEVLSQLHRHGEQKDLILTTQVVLHHTISQRESLGFVLDFSTLVFAHHNVFIKRYVWVT